MVVTPESEGSGSAASQIPPSPFHWAPELISEEVWPQQRNVFTTSHSSISLSDYLATSDRAQ